MAEIQGGFDITQEDRKGVKLKDLCGKCQKIVRNALQTQCGHRFCCDCLDSEFTQEGIAMCPVCKEPLTRDQVFKDKFADREVQALVLSCLFAVFGCKWKGELRHREAHQKTCEFAPINCINPGCDQKVPRKSLADHLQNECLYRELRCSYCNQPYVAASAKEHEERCPAIPAKCPSCGKEFQRSELEKHRNPFSPEVCEYLETPCPFVPAGCEMKKPMERKDRKAHMEQYADKHLNLLLSKVLALSSYLNDLVPGMGSGFKNGKLFPGLQAMQAQVVNQITVVTQDLEGRIRQLETKINAQGYASLAPPSYGNSAAVSDLVRRLDNNDAKGASHELLLNEAHATIAELRQELTRVSQKLERTEESNRRLEKRVADQEQLAGLRNLAIADLEERVKDTIGASYDGIMLFKITQVARKRADAVSGRQISFYSPAFYTDPHGYKMCARVYLNGDGMGKVFPEACFNMAGNQGGFDITEEDRKGVKPKDLCGKCQKIVRNALQTQCGHRFCCDCLDSEFTQDGIAICPVCKEPLTRDQVFKDKFADREVQALVLSCLFAVFGCKWKGELRHREEHQKTCEFAPINCINPGCDQKVPRKSLADHLQNECLYRELRCSYCNQPYVAASAKEHEERCPAMPATWPSCGKEIKRSLEKHRNPFSPEVCEYLETPCPFVPAGCEMNKPMERKDRKAHMEQYADKHLNLLLSKVLALSSYLNDLEGRIRQLETKINAQGYASLAPPSHGNSAAVSDLVLSLDHHSDAQGASHELLLNEAHATIAELKQKLTRVNQKERTEESNRRLGASHEFFPNKAHATIPKAVQESVRTNRREERTEEAGLRNLAIADLEERVKDTTGASYDGIMLFKITQVARKRADAASGEHISFDSPAFYTDPHGYKMCARVYLNGDGMGKGTHISLFFVIMRGEYDALLQWPFRQEVTLMLLDQDNEEHVIDDFRPDPNSSSFQRPKGEMNIASGCPLFCPHTELQRHAYIRDDTMFIKIIVDTRK